MKCWATRSPCSTTGSFGRLITWVMMQRSFRLRERATAKGTKTVQEDRGLIRYLMRHWHTTPFEMCVIKFHVKLPIFVARQWIRHRTASVNETSARYSILDNEFYIPQPEHLAAQSKTNNQGRGEVLGPDEAQAVLDILREDALRAYGNYEEMLRKDEDEGKKGLARELARMNLPTNIYTQWYWKIDLHNLFHFLRLRVDSHAQYEIRAYSEVMSEIVERWLPTAFQAFVDYRLNACHFSAQEMAVLREILLPARAQGTLGPEAKRKLIEGGATQREVEDFLAKLHI